MKWHYRALMLTGFKIIDIIVVFLLIFWIVCDIKFSFWHLNDGCMQIMLIFRKFMKVNQMQAHQNKSKFYWINYLRYRVALYHRKKWETLKQLIASVNTQIRVIFKVVSTEELWMDMFIYCKGKVYCHFVCCSS